MEIRGDERDMTPEPDSDSCAMRGIDETTCMGARGSDGTSVHCPEVMATVVTLERAPDCRKDTLKDSGVTGRHFGKLSSEGSEKNNYLYYFCDFGVSLKGLAKKQTWRERH